MCGLIASVHDLMLLFGRVEQLLLVDGTCSDDLDFLNGCFEESVSSEGSCSNDVELNVLIDVCVLRAHVQMN